MSKVALWRPKQPVWRDLGVVIPEGQQITAQEALRSANADHQVDTYQLYFRTPDGTEIPIPKFAVVRAPTPEAQDYAFLSVASKKYPLLQTSDIACSVQALAEKYPLDTVASLDNGAMTFFVLKGPTTEVLGEQIEFYCLIVDNKQQGGRFRVTQIPVRASSQTCLNGDIATSLIDTPMYSGQTQPQELAYRLALLPHLEEVAGHLTANLAQLGGKEAGPQDVSAVLAATYPEPGSVARSNLLSDMRKAGLEPDHETKATLENSRERRLRERSKHKRFRDEALDYWERSNDLHPQLAGTALSLFISICEYEDYRKGQRGLAQRSALFGDRALAKANAYRACALL